MLIHSPVLHLNMVGPSHAFTAQKERSQRCSPNIRGRKTGAGACVKIRVTYAAAKLVAEVSAVVHPVTLESASNAGAVHTLELIRSASRTACNSSRSRSKPRYGAKLVRRQKIGTEMISRESMLTGLSVCRQHPTHLFGSVRDDIGFIKDFSSAVV